MITLITGAPGAGKTLLAVSEILKPEADKGRHIIADAIPDLVLQHEPAPVLSEWTKTVVDHSSQTGEKLLFTFPQGSLIVIDEAQRVYRPRAVGSKVPPEVAAFETHRHQGLDFVILTQHPNLIDSNVRKLVGRHLHIRDIGILGRKVYEWPEVGNVEQFRNAPVQRRYSLDSKSFGLYKSASLHVKPKRGIPKGLVLLAFAVVALVGGIGFAWHSIGKKLNPSVSSVQTTPGPQAAGAAVASGSVAQISPVKTGKTADEFLTEHLPVMPGRPETAPIYDGLRQVKSMPVVVGCISTANKCRCVNQQGTDAGLDDLQCRNWMKSPPFDPYRDSPKPDSQPLADSARPAAPVGQGRPGQGAPVIEGDTISLSPPSPERRTTFSF